MLGLESGRAFAPKIQYVYEKQLEEADLLVLNKIDLLSGDRCDALVAALGERFPAATVVPVSARTGDGLDAWFARLSGAVAPRPATEVDYDSYAEGEAMLGWLNATVRIVSVSAFDGNRLLDELAIGVRDRLSAAGIEIAHFKMTLTPDGRRGIAVVNLVATDARLDAALQLTGPVAGGRLTINLRAEADPISCAPLSTWRSIERRPCSACRPSSSEAIISGPAGRSPRTASPHRELQITEPPISASCLHARKPHAARIERDDHADPHDVRHAE
jgi:hypothetical protein